MRSELFGASCATDAWPDSNFDGKLRSRLTFSISSVTSAGLLSSWMVVSMPTACEIEFVTGSWRERDIKSFATGTTMCSEMQKVFY
jgi:hypothetical protein